MGVWSLLLNHCGWDNHGCMGGFSDNSIFPLSNNNSKTD